MRRQFIITTISGILFALPVFAAAQRIPNTFVPGEPALAEEVNENFQVLAGPDTGTVFIPPKAIDATADRGVALGVGDSFTAAFGRPIDYVPGTAPDITIRPLFSGCVDQNVEIGVTSDFLVIGANVDTVEPRQAVEFLMPNLDTTVATQSYTRTGLGDVNYITVDRALATTAPACAVDFDFHGIIIEYPR